MAQPPSTGRSIPVIWRDTGEARNKQAFATSSSVVIRRSAYSPAWRSTASASEIPSLAANVGTTYEFDFNVTGTTTAVLKLTNVALASGHKYTIYLVGPSTALQGIVTQDL